MKTISIENSEIYYSIALHLELPSKYAYIGEGAHFWSELTKRWTKTGANTNSEAILLRDSIHQIAKEIKHAHPDKTIHVIDLGCGNGGPAEIVCSALSKEEVLLRYTAVDISSQMIDSALMRVQHAFHNELQCSSFTFDFESQSPKHIVEKLCSGQHINLFLFLGNTIGNYLHPHELVKGVADAMSPQDYLIVGNGLVPMGDPNQLVKTYDIAEERQLLCSAAKRIGIPLKNIRFIWAPHGEVQALADIEHDILLRHHSQTVILREGTELLLLRSRKYTPKKLASLLTASGLRITQQWINPVQSNILLLGVRRTQDR
jgi:uncharacterized SAM-dependent methyltransferase